MKNKDKRYAISKYNPKTKEWEIQGVYLTERELKRFFTNVRKNKDNNAYTVLEITKE